MINPMIRSPKLSALPGIKHGFFTRLGGVSEGIYTSLNGGQGSSDKPYHVAENRARMAAELGVALPHLLSAYQIHSADVIEVKAPWGMADRPRVDAMVTSVPGLALSILTADCGPVLFADVKAGVIGAAHAGWKGAMSGVLEATINAMEMLGARRQAISACLGMTISQKNYEVGPEFLVKFLAEDVENMQFFKESQTEGHAMFNLPAYIGERLQRAGIGEFEDLGLCTYGDEARFFSYRRTTHRREPDYGRHISAIALVG